jgi:hypothetical protein
MAWWVYLGKVTTSVDGGISAIIDERGDKPVIVKRDHGPAVLVPRLKFEAPMSVVAHLTRLKLVRPLKPHMIPKEEKPDIKPESKPVKKDAPKVAVLPAPPEPKKIEDKPKEAPSDDSAPVVASIPVEEEKNLPQDDDDTGEEMEKAQQEKQQEKGGKKGSKKRRG